MCTRTESNGYPEKRSACASLYNYFVEKRLIRSMGDSRVVSPRFPLYLLFPLVGTTTVFENNNIQRIENKEAKLSLIIRPEIGRKNIIIIRISYFIFKNNYYFEAIFMFKHTKAKQTYSLFSFEYFYVKYPTRHLKLVFFVTRTGIRQQNRKKICSSHCPFATRFSNKDYR